MQVVSNIADTQDGNRAIREETATKWDCQSVPMRENGG
jgi:hypothetical protein